MVRSQEKSMAAAQQASCRPCFDDIGMTVAYMQSLPRSLDATRKSVERGFDMPKKIQPQRKPWTEEQLQQLRKLANENTPTRLMGLKLGRTEGSIRSKAASEGISLKPANQSPYG
jgi:hypothetical protein